MGRYDDETIGKFKRWQEKPILRRVYCYFYEKISDNLSKNNNGITVELGSGFGGIKETTPQCILTDVHSNQWVDKVEDAYSLSFEDSSVSNLILFDVFHHLQYPGSALKEFHRVLNQNGRVVIFEPCLSILGFLVYGLLHQEPLGMQKPIQWLAPSDTSLDKTGYYAAQANAAKIFLSGDFDKYLQDWNIVKIMRYSAISYVASGGYSKPQFYPDWAYPVMRVVDRLCDFMPLLFATRVLVVLEKRCSTQSNTVFTVATPVEPL